MVVPKKTTQAMPGRNQANTVCTSHGVVAMQEGDHHVAPTCVTVRT